MAVDKAVDSTLLNNNLTSVANAIRTKGGTSAPLEFPTEFVSAIQNIPTPTGTKSISITQNGTTTENVADYASAQITTNVPQMQRIILRPDAELVQSWTYDKRIVADEGVTIPAYSTANQTLKASEQIAEIAADTENYRYFLVFRTLAIPEYNTEDVGRGRFEWSCMVGAYEFIFTPMEGIKPLVSGEYRISTNSAAVQGNVSYRGICFASATSISIYATNIYGIWTPSVAPSYVSGNIRINTPNFTMRGQPNIFDQPFWEALTDIRFQYVFELWREPIDSLQYRGWSNQQSVDKALDCLYSTNHKLT